MSAQVWRGWALPLPGGAVCLDQNAAALVLFLLRRYAHEEAGRNGLADLTASSPLVREVRNACEVSTRGMSENGRVLRTSAVDEARSEPRPDDLLTTAQVAEELNMTDRNARRLAASGALGAVTLAGRAKLVRRFEVDAYRKGNTR